MTSTGTVSETDGEAPCESEKQAVLVEMGAIENNITKGMHAKANKSEVTSQEADGSKCDNTSTRGGKSEHVEIGAQPVVLVDGSVMSTVVGQPDTDWADKGTLKNPALVSKLPGSSDSLKPCTHLPAAHQITATAETADLTSPKLVEDRFRLAQKNQDDSMEVRELNLASVTSSAAQLLGKTSHQNEGAAQRSQETAALQEAGSKIFASSVKMSMVHQNVNSEMEGIDLERLVDHMFQEHADDAFALDCFKERLDNTLQVSVLLFLFF